VDDALKYLDVKSLAEPSADPMKLILPLSGWRQYSEYIYILRPLIYVLSIRKFGKNSYAPWVLSLATEVGCLMTNFDLKTLTYKHSLTALEKEEVKRRRYLFLYYLLRSPFYNDFTK
jgi:peroxin-16